MKKLILFSLLLLTIYKGTLGQTITVTGNITNQQGKPVPFAFVCDVKNRRATYTDSLGSFNLKATPASRLTIICNDYKNSYIDVENAINLNIVLLAGVPGNSVNATDNISDNIFKTHTESMEVANTGKLAISAHQEETHGSRYLFNNWVHGYIINQQDSIVQNPNYWFNYDKIGGTLLLTQNKKTMLAINNGMVNEFTLFDDNAQPYVFQNMPTIDKKHYSQLISSGSKYKIYKVLGTKLERANYTTNGISSSGHNYDEYVDDSIYYLIKGAEGQPQKLILKKKSLKEMFVDEGDKLNKFLSEQGVKEEENYIKSLGDYMNM